MGVEQGAIKRGKDAWNKRDFWGVLLALQALSLVEKRSWFVEERGEGRQGRRECGSGDDVDRKIQIAGKKGGLELVLYVLQGIEGDGNEMFGSDGIESFRDAAR